MNFINYNYMRLVSREKQMSNLISVIHYKNKLTHCSKSIIHQNPSINPNIFKMIVLSPHAKE